MPGSVVADKLNEVNQNWSSGFFFLDPDYIDTFADDSLIVSSQGKDCLLQFKVVGDEAYSPASASFGGPSFRPGLIDKHVLTDFMLEAESYLRSNGVSLATVRIMPEAYSSDYVGLCSDVLESIGFKRLQIDINQHIKIGKDYEVIIEYNELKKLRQSEASMQFRFLGSEYLDQSYEVIRGNRDRKGFPMSMSVDKLKMLFESFPKNYLLSGVFREDQLVATGVSIKINGQILYNFYHGDIHETRSKSPVVMLVKGIYEYALKEGYRILDLGVSTDNGILNKGLYAFKKNLGCVDSERITWQKML